MAQTIELQVVRETENIACLEIGELAGIADDDYLVGDVVLCFNGEADG